MNRNQSLKMADTFCDRVDRRLFDLGVSVHTAVHAMGKLTLKTSRLENGVRLQRAITLDDFSKFTAEDFSQLEDVVVKELTP